MKFNEQVHQSVKLLLRIIFVHVILAVFFFTFAYSADSKGHGVLDIEITLNVISISVKESFLSTTSDDTDRDHIVLRESDNVSYWKAKGWKPVY